jgi:hypothetical protein
MTNANDDPIDFLKLVRAEFLEMPGMSLTAAQAARLWRLTPERADLLLRELVLIGFLVRDRRQQYHLPSAV